MERTLALFLIGQCGTAVTMYGGRRSPTSYRSCSASHEDAALQKYKHCTALQSIAGFYSTKQFVTYTANALN